MLTMPQVILLLAGATTGTMGLLLTLLAHRYSYHIKGVSEWGAGLLIVSSTIIFSFLFRETVGQVLMTAIAHIMVLTGIMLLDFGLRRFFEDKDRYSTTVIILFLAAFIISTLWFSLVNPDFEIRTLITTSGGAFVFVDMLFLLFKNRRHGTGVLILIFSITSLLAVRIATIYAVIVGIPMASSFYDATTTQVVMLMVPSVIVPLATLAFILMGSERLIDKLNETIRHDDLTGTLNKTALYQKMENEITRCVRYQRAMCVIMIDLDNFKEINDTHGHLKGDQYLKDVASKICGSVRGTDVVARFGGDEFAVLLIETDLEQSRPIANRILLGVQSVLPEYCGASVGISSLRSHGETVNSILHRADQALYRAKVAGKNQMAFA